MISFSEAKSLILKHSKSNKKLLFKISLNKANHFVLAENLKARCYSPPFNQSAMDGYALNFSSILAKSAISSNPLLENSAGKSVISRIPKDQAVRIFTGAKMPTNGEVVIPQEYVTVNHNNQLNFDSEKFKLFDNVRKKGSQFKKGEIILRKGEVLTASKIALAATAGHSTLNVFAAPKIAIIVSGSELIPPGKTLTGDKIYESNSVMLEALLNDNRIKITSTRFVKDNMKSCISAIQHALKEADVILISGGISVGKYDLIKEALDQLKTQTIFHKIKQKPGKPLFFGKNKNKFIFGLPGNPAASLTCFYEYVLPLIRSLSGYNDPFGIPQTAKLNGNFSKKAGLTHFLKGYVHNNYATILPDQESYKITSFSDANCLIVIPEEITELNNGNEVEYHLI